VPTVVLPLRLCTRFDLPAVCILTGETDGVIWKTVAFRISVKAPLVPVDLPFTEEAFARWSRAHRRWPALGFVTFFALIFLGILGRHSLETSFGIRIPPLGVTLALMGLGIPIVVLTVARIRGSGPILVAIDKETITLRIPSERAAAALRELGQLRFDPRAALPAGARCHGHAAEASFVCARCGSFGCPTCLGPKPAEPFLCEACRARRVGEQAQLEQLLESQGSRRLIVFGALAAALSAGALLLVILLH
jgi:hypothetical protein